jgi:hypothetical protein
MHNTFWDILNWWPENVFIYMDDFLVATPNKTPLDIQLHRTIVHVVSRLRGALAHDCAEGMEVE